MANERKIVRTPVGPAVHAAPKRSAAREFQIIQTLDHRGILPVLDYKEHENGPALLFRYLDPNAVRFDHYLATNCEKLSPGQRLEMLRQIADAIRYAHVSGSFTGPLGRRAFW